VELDELLNELLLVELELLLKDEELVEDEELL